MKGNKPEDPPSDGRIVVVALKGYGYFTGFYDHIKKVWRVRSLDRISVSVPPDSEVMNWREFQ